MVAKRRSNSQPGRLRMRLMEGQGIWGGPGLRTEVKSPSAPNPRVEIHGKSGAPFARPVQGWGRFAFQSLRARLASGRPYAWKAECTYESPSSSPTVARTGADAGGRRR